MRLAYNVAHTGHMRSDRHIFNLVTSETISHICECALWNCMLQNITMKTNEMNVVFLITGSS